MEEIVDYIEEFVEKVKSWDLEGKHQQLKAWMTSDEMCARAEERLTKLGYGVHLDPQAFTFNGSPMCRAITINRHRKPERYTQKDIRIARSVLEDIPDFKEQIVLEGKAAFKRDGFEPMQYFFHSPGTNAHENTLILSLFGQVVHDRLMLCVPEDEIKEQVAYFKGLNNHLVFADSYKTGYCQDDFIRNHITAIIKFWPK